MRLSIAYERALAENPEIVKELCTTDDSKRQWFYDVHIETDPWELLTAPDNDSLEKMVRKYLLESSRVKLTCTTNKEIYLENKQFDVVVPEALVEYYVKSFTLLLECKALEAMRAVWRDGLKAVGNAARLYAKDDPKFEEFSKYVELKRVS